MLWSGRFLVHHIGPRRPLRTPVGKSTMSFIIFLEVGSRNRKAFRYVSTSFQAILIGGIVLLTPVGIVQMVRWSRLVRVYHRTMPRQMSRNNGPDGEPASNPQSKTGY